MENTESKDTEPGKSNIRENRAADLRRSAVKGDHDMQYAAIDSVTPDRDVLRCLPESREEKQQLLDYQGALGIGAYDNGVFVGSL